MPAGQYKSGAKMRKKKPSKRKGLMGAFKSKMGGMLGGSAKKIKKLLGTAGKPNTSKRLAKISRGIAGSAGRKKAKKMKGRTVKRRRY